MNRICYTGYNFKKSELISESLYYNYLNSLFEKIREEINTSNNDEFEKWISSKNRPFQVLIIINKYFLLIFAISILLLHFNLNDINFDSGFDIINGLLMGQKGHLISLL